MIRSASCLLVKPLLIISSATASNNLFLLVSLKAKLASGILAGLKNLNVSSLPRFLVVKFSEDTLKEDLQAVKEINNRAPE
jgi:hypothetical protein